MEQRDRGCGWHAHRGHDRRDGVQTLPCMYAQPAHVPQARQTYEAFRAVAIRLVPQGDMLEYVVERVLMACTDSRAVY